MQSAHGCRVAWFAKVLKAVAKQLGLPKSHSVSPEDVVVVVVELVAVTEQLVGRALVFALRGILEMGFKETYPLDI